MNVCRYLSVILRYRRSKIYLCHSLVRLVVYQFYTESERERDRERETEREREGEREREREREREIER